MTTFRGINTDPIRNFKFKVVFPVPNGGVGRAGFSRVSGLKETTEAIQYREGTDPARPRQLPGQTTFENIVCERGLTNNTDLLEWRRLITNVPSRGRDLGGEGNVQSGGVGDGGGLGDFVRRELQVQLGDYHAEGGLDGAWVWTALAAWPTEYEASEFSGDGNDVVLETVAFAHEGLQTDFNP